MGKVALPAVGLALLGLSVVAAEKPTDAHVALMKSNAAAQMSLRNNIAKKDYDLIAKDAATFKANFTQVEAFWTPRRVDDAIGFARTGLKAATDLESAAQAKNDEGVAAAFKVLLGVCTSCHMAHRELLPDRTFEIK
jgi:hypothetical protein